MASRISRWRSDLVHRRVEQMKAEGVEFVTNCRVGFDITADEMRAKYDAIALTMGATKPRDLPIPGTRAERNPLRDGFSAAAEQAQLRRPLIPPPRSARKESAS